MPENVLLEVEGLRKTFRVGRQRLRAVHNVSIQLKSGESLGLVGESGSGKSTLGRCIMGLLRPDEGQVRFGGRNITRLGRGAKREVWRELQIIFQDPQAALNPRMTVARNIMDPLVAHRIGSPADRDARVAQLLQLVGLDIGQAEVYPFELSGGQQQRVMIARALTLGPKLMVCDEPVSALDVSVQAQIMALLRELKAKQGLSYLFISHNVPAVAQISDSIAVMYLGQIVETAPVADLFHRPKHPYTRALLESVLALPARKADRRSLQALPGEIPSPLNVPSGCPFHTRCPIAVDKCRTDAPTMRVIYEGAGNGVGGRHQVACHLA